MGRGESAGGGGELIIMKTVGEIIGLSGGGGGVWLPV